MAQRRAPRAVRKLDTKQLTVFVDYDNPELRQIPGAHKFMVVIERAYVDAERGGRRVRRRGDYAVRDRLAAESAGCAMNRPMTLAEFRATGRDVEDVSEIAGDREPRPRRVYAGDAFMERAYVANGVKGEGWYLLIEPSEFTADTYTELEPILYEWALTSSAI